MLVTQSCLLLCNPKDCSLPGSSVHGIFQARILEWVASSFSRGSSPPRDGTRVSHIAGRFFTVWATRHILKITFRQQCMVWCLVCLSFVVLYLPLTPSLGEMVAFRFSCGNWGSGVLWQDAEAWLLVAGSGFQLKPFVQKFSSLPTNPLLTPLTAGDVALNIWTR